MGIKLKVNEYCQNCINFEAKVNKPTIYEGRNPRTYQLKEELCGDTEVYCTHWKMCKNVADWFEGHRK